MTGARGPALGARIVAALAALAWGFFFFGLIDLAVVILQDEQFYEMYLLETGWGLLYTVLVAVPLVAFALRPRSPLLLNQLMAVAAAVSLAAIITPALPQLIAATALVATAVALAALSRQRLSPIHGWPAQGADGLLAVLVVVAAVPAVAYAAQMIHAARSGKPDDETWWLNHLPMQAAFGVAVVVTAALATMGEASGEPGWRVPAWSAAVSAAWLGAVSVVYPDHLGSLGSTLGTAAVVWGALFAARAQVAVGDPRWRLFRRPAR